MRILILTAVLTLSGCGVADVGGAAVTAAKLQAEQAKQGKAEMDKMKTDIEAATRADQNRVEKQGAAE